MPVPDESKSTHRAATFALVCHEARVLRQNRLACVVLAMLPLVALFLRIDRERTPPAAKGVCYVLYWAEDEFVRFLRREAADPKLNGDLKIEIQPAGALTGDDGMIRYPPGSHSIQLRTPERVVWYWHSGSDPAAMWPCIEWFQRAALRHFGSHGDWQVQTSSMRPEFVVLGKQTRITWDSIRNPDVMDPLLVWLGMFFAACHLPKLSLAESIAARTLLSIAVTPAGFPGAARAMLWFYGSVALGVTAATAAILRPDMLNQLTFWASCICSTVLYLGVAFAVGSACRSVASASIGTMVYLAASGLWYALVMGASRFVGGVPATTLVPEAAFLELLQSVWNGQSGSIISLASVACWAVFWSAIGEISYRRMQDQ